MATPKKKYGMGGPKGSSYVGNPMGYFNDKAMYGKEQMMKAQDGGFMNDLKKSYDKRTMQADTSTCSDNSCRLKKQILTSRPKKAKAVNGIKVRTAKGTKALVKR